MKVVYALNSFLPQSLAGTEIYTYQLAKYVIESGHIASIIIPEFNQNHNQPYHYENIQVHKYYEPTKSSHEFVVGKKAPDGIENFISLIKVLKPDIIHFQMISSGTGITIYHLIELKRLGYRCGLTIHLSHYSCLTGNLLEYNKKICNGKIENKKCTLCYLNSKKVPVPFTKLLFFGLKFVKSLKLSNLYKNDKFDILNYAKQKKQNIEILKQNLDFIIPITNWYKEILRINDYTNNVYLIKQGLIPMEINSDLTTSNHGGILKIIFIGRIVPIKGLLIALQALINIDPKLYRLDIYGDYIAKSDYYQKCSEIIKSYNLAATFHGRLDRYDIYKTLVQNDYLCLPSLFSEMSPLVIQEAQYAGIPVIGSNVPGILEEVKHLHNGIIFSYGNVKQLSALFKLLINKKVDRSSLVKNIKAPRLFKEVGEETLAVYKKILKDD